MKASRYFCFSHFSLSVMNYAYLPDGTVVSGDVNDVISSFVEYDRD